MLVASIALITALPTIAADAPPVDDSAMWAHLELMAEPRISRADALSLAEKHVISKGFDVSSGYVVTAHWQPALKLWSVQFTKLNAPEARTIHAVVEEERKVRIWVGQ